MAIKAQLEAQLVRSEPYKDLESACSCVFQE